MRSLGQRASHFAASFWLSWPVLPKSATHPPWLNGKNLRGSSPPLWMGELRAWGILICVFAAVHLDKGLEGSAANRCTIRRRVFGVCCMLLKVSMKCNIIDFQRLASRVIKEIVSEVQLPMSWLGWLLSVWPLPSYLTSLILWVLIRKMKITIVIKYIYIVQSKNMHKVSSSWYVMRFQAKLLFCYWCFVIIPLLRETPFLPPSGPALWGWVRSLHSVLP